MQQASQPPRKRKDVPGPTQDTSDDSANKRQQTADTIGSGTATRAGTVTLEEVEDEDAPSPPTRQAKSKVVPPNPWLGMNKEQLEAVRGECIPAAQENYAHQGPDKLLSKYNAPVHVLYKQPAVSLCNDGRLQLAFVCAKPGCKQPTAVNHYEHHQTGSDNGSTGGLIVHAMSCWGSDKYEEVAAARTKVAAKEQVKHAKQGTLTFLFGTKNGKPRFGFKNHTLLEVRYVVNGLTGVQC